MKDWRVTIDEIDGHLMRRCVLQTGRAGLSYFEIVELLGREEAGSIRVGLGHAPVLLRHPLLVLLLLEQLIAGSLIEQCGGLGLTGRVLLLALRTMIYCL